MGEPHLLNAYWVPGQPPFREDWDLSSAHHVAPLSQHKMTMVLGFTNIAGFLKEKHILILTQEFKLWKKPRTQESEFLAQGHHLEVVDLWGQTPGYLIAKPMLFQKALQHAG